MNPNSVSPKVWTQAVVALVLGTLVAGIGAVTPGMLSALGAWAPVVFAALTALGAGLAGYMVTDPIRALGTGTLAIHKSIAAAAPKDLPAVPVMTLPVAVVEPDAPPAVVEPDAPPAVVEPYDPLK